MNRKWQLSWGLAKLSWRTGMKVAIELGISETELKNQDEMAIELGIQV